MCHHRYDIGGNRIVGELSPAQIYMCVDSIILRFCSKKTTSQHVDNQNLYFLLKLKITKTVVHVSAKNTLPLISELYWKHSAHITVTTTNLPWRC